MLETDVGVIPLPLFALRFFPLQLNVVHKCCQFFFLNH
jgi:hypothetical protein